MANVAAGTIEIPKTRKQRPWHELRPGTASTGLRDEFRARGFGAAVALFHAKRAFAKRRIKTMEKLARLIDAGVPNDEAVVALYRQATNKGRNPRTPLGYVFGEWMRRSSEGQSLSEFTRGWLPPDAEPLIKAGEESSNVPKALHDYIFVAEKKKQMMRTAMSALKTPMSNFAIIVVFLWVLAYKMNPIFSEAVPRSAWTGSLLIVGFLSDIVKDDVFYVVGAIAALVAAVVWSMENVLGKRRQKLERFPPWSIYRQFYGSSFLLSFAALYGAGKVDADIVRTLLKTANGYYAERLRAFLKYIEKGEKIGDTLALSGYNFPDPELVQDMQIYQRLPDLPIVLDKVSRAWTEDNIRNIQAATNAMAAVLTAISFLLTILMLLSNFEFVGLVQNYASH
jgi:type II secretory pathway component PulF